MDWLYQLEKYALKKQASEELFRQIREELKDVLGDKTSYDYKFTIEQVRAKLKWFKKEWRSIDNKIKCGSGLGGKDTKVPKWYDIMNPHFCDAVDDMTSLSCKADDLNLANESEEEDTGCYSDVSSEGPSVVKSSKKPRLATTSSSVESDEEGTAVTSVQSSSSQSGAEPKQVDAEKDINKGKKLSKGKSPKKSTKIMLHSKRNSKPRSQSDAMIQVAKSIENSTRQQEENKDIRLQAFLASERKRDDMFFAYQREQAEANRKHEMMMAQILLQATSTVRPQYANSCMPPASQPLPPTGSFSGWNNAYSAIGGEPQDEGPFYRNM